jgi:hypothetical protein
MCQGDPNPPLTTDRFGATNFVDIAAKAGDITSLKDRNSTLTEIGGI